MSNHHIAPHVSGLLCAGSPAAILRAVVPIIILAIQCQAGSISWRHVRQEVSKVIPSLAHADAASSVVMVCGALRGHAPLPDRAPHVIEALNIWILRPFVAVSDSRFTDATTLIISQNNFSLHTNAPFVFGLGLARSVQLHAGPSFYPAASAQSTRFA